MNAVAPGYMILLTLMLSAVGITTMTYIAHRAVVYEPLMRVAVQKEKAAALALSGIQVALSQLAGQKLEEDVALSLDTRMLNMLLPRLGRWQEFSLKEKQDGIDGTIKICIVSEDGKFDINAVYDFKTKKFVGEQETQEDKNYKKILETLLTRVGSLMGAENLFPALEKFLRKRDSKLNDVTELLTIKEFEPFKHFVVYEPDKDKQKCALLDLFTVWNGTTKLNAWLLSFSIQHSIGEMKDQEKKVIKDDAQIKKIIDMYKPNFTVAQAWEQVFSPLYAIPLASLSSYAQGVLDTKFGPTAFSVLSYGVVGKTIQKLLAIVTLKKEPSSESDAAYSVVIKKLYWL